MPDTPYYYRRNLPHIQPPGACIFVTFRLAGSLPRAVLESVRQERRQLALEEPRSGENPRERAVREAKRLFSRMDELLGKECADPDAATPKWLADPRVAEMVREALHFRDNERYCLLRYVIMPNHVHLLIRPLPLDNSAPGASPGEDIPCWPLRRILQGLKGYTAREGNRFLGRKGRFWQDESFDHFMRDDEEYSRAIRYIDRTPVAAGLCQVPSDWPWSSAGEPKQHRPSTL